MPRCMTAGLVRCSVDEERRGVERRAGLLRPGRDARAGEVAPDGVTGLPGYGIAANASSAGPGDFVAQ
jgi:hypothetical protein